MIVVVADYVTDPIPRSDWRDRPSKLYAQVILPGVVLEGVAGRGRIADGP